MSNGNYPSPDVAYQGVHALIGYGAVLTAAFSLHRWSRRYNRFRDDQEDH